MTFGGPGGDTPADLIVDREGRLVAVGSAHALRQGSTGWAVARFSTDGARDGLFGIETPASEGASLAAVAAVEDAHGRIVVTGIADRVPAEMVTVRYKRDGSLDRGYGTSGEARLALGPNGSVGALTRNPRGGVFVAGARGRTAIVASYDAAGRLRKGFGEDGVSSLTGARMRGMIPRAIVRMAAGRLVVGGTARTRSGFTSLALVRLTPRGDVDGRFSHDGISRTTFGDGSTSFAGLALVGGGRILAAGNATSTRFDQADRGSVGLVRYLRSGRRDRDFGRRGLAMASLGGAGSDLVAGDMARLGDGSIVIGGHARRRSSGPDRFSLVSFTARGRFVGVTTGPYAAQLASITALAPTDRSRLVAAGPVGDDAAGAQEWDSALARYRLP